MTHRVDVKLEYKAGDLVLCVNDSYHDIGYNEETNTYLYEEKKHKTIVKGHIYEVAAVDQYNIVSLKEIKGSRYNHWKFRRIK